VGREREIDDLEPLLSRCRLVTLVGPGGAGKTRLALEVARRHSGTVAWVELSAVIDPNLIAHQVLSALGGRSGGQSLAIETVLDLLGGGPCLVVLDNCEHLIEGCALFARAILHGTSTPSILATSREALGVAGEHVWPVPPLSLPDAARALSDSSSSEAVTLFVERARAVSPRFALDHRNAGAVAEICRRLDGLPLAIELAAARVRALSPDEIARRIAASFKLLASADRAVDPRHRTLEATIGWSFDLLGEEERALLLRLSVFAGSFSIEAAERVCSCEQVPVERLLDLLMALVDRSLVLAEPRGVECRYRLLETVRQYAAERLEPAAAAELDEIHARTFLDLAEQAEPHIAVGAADAAWIARLEADHANLRAAIDWALRDASRAGIALRMAAALHWFWFTRGRLREGRRALARALALDAPEASVLRARALIALGMMAVWQSDLDAVPGAMKEGAKALENAPVGDFWRVYALCGLAIAQTIEGQVSGTLKLVDEAVTLARRHHHTMLVTFALYWRARVLGAVGDFPRALADIEEATSVSRAHGHRQAYSLCRGVEGKLRLAAGDADAAASPLRESLLAHVENEDLWGLARTLEDLATLALIRQQFARAVAFHAAAERMRDLIGTPLWPVELATMRAGIAVCRERLSAVDFERAWQLGATYDLPALVALFDETLAAGDAEASSNMAVATGSAAVTAEPVATAEPAPAARGDGAARAGAALGPSAEATTAVTLDIRALGPTEIRIDGAAVDGLWGRPQELLVLLAWNGDGLRREDVGLALWPDASPEKLRNLFHVTLHRLRKCMGAREWVVREGERYRLTPSIPWRLDARQFDTVLRDALRSVRQQPGGGRGVDELAAALELYRGVFLQGESAGEWHFEIRERLDDLWLEGTRALAQALLAAGRDAEAGAVFRRLLQREPADEDASLALMSCALRRGERNEALREYRRLERALQDELGVEPGPEVAALYKRMRGAGWA
jgi:non-specific serine/threonine protein kinase